MSDLGALRASPSESSDRPADPLRGFQGFRVGVFGTSLGRAGLLILAVVVAFCFIGPLVYHTEQVRTNIANVLQRPSGSHLLGTDANGYDELGRLMLGGRSALGIGLLAAVLASVFGSVYGALAGYFGGLLDAVLMRVVDTFLALPGLLILLVLASVFSPSFLMLALVIGMFAWLAPSRLLRGESLVLRTREYVQASRLAGAGHAWVVVRHILPNAINVIVVNATFQVADAILVVSTLSFLGFGVPPPATNWGSMLNDGVNYSAAGYWWLLYPAGVLIILTVMSLNFIGEGIEAASGGGRR